MEKINEIFKKYALVRDQETLDPNSDPLFKITLGDDYAYLKTCVNFLSDVLDALEQSMEEAEKYRSALREIRNEIEKENKQ